MTAGEAGPGAGEAARGRAEASHHLVPVPVYLLVFVSLLLLTGLTVWVATLDLGAWNWLHTPLALGIAVTKATLVALWFMHLRYSERLTWVFIAAGILWLGFLIVITMGDYLSRHRDAEPSIWTLEAITVPGPAGPADPAGPAEPAGPADPAASILLASWS